jgi:hypothetical protein
MACCKAIAQHSPWVGSGRVAPTRSKLPIAPTFWPLVSTALLHACIILTPSFVTSSPSASCVLLPTSPPNPSIMNHVCFQSHHQQSPLHVHDLSVLKSLIFQTSNFKFISYPVLKLIKKFCATCGSGSRASTRTSWPSMSILQRFFSWCQPLFELVRVFFGLIPLLFIYVTSLCIR